MAKVKGSVILNGRDYVLAEGGADAWGRVLAHVGDDDRQTVAAVIPVGWYDIGLYDRINRALVEGWGSREELTCVRLGAYMFRLFQLVGARNGSLERVACTCRGDPACIFAATWD